METDMIKITHLKKSFGDVKAVNDLSFQVKKGEFFAFLGVNGAGKSTTISIICGQLRKDSGTVRSRAQIWIRSEGKLEQCLAWYFRTVCWTSHLPSGKI